MKRMLVTGGLGFIGSNFIEYMLKKYPQLVIYNLDSQTYAGNPENLASVANLPNYREIHGDIGDANKVEQVFQEGIDTVVHFAAESHVDRSVTGPHVFVQTNVVGTHVLLMQALKYKVKRFIHISTDEVYGTLGDSSYFTEEHPMLPNSPYSASKAGADMLVRAYYQTYGLPAIITRCSNNYGPRQHPEKFIPLIITHALQSKPIPVYGDGNNVRDWLFVADHCKAIDAVLSKGKVGEVYNIGGNNEQKNIEVARKVLRALGKPESLIQYVPDRPGHDHRYAIDPGKIKRELLWEPLYDMDQGLEETIKWYFENPAPLNSHQ